MAGGMASGEMVLGVGECRACGERRCWECVRMGGEGEGGAHNSVSMMRKVVEVPVLLLVSTLRPQRISGCIRKAVFRYPTTTRTWLCALPSSEML